MALTPGQVRAGAEPEPETEQPAQIVCDGLYSLTMSVNTMTLKRMGELTKYSYSTNRECEMSLTLRDVSSEDNLADITKSCTVTPIRPDNAIDLASTESGDCDTVAIAANLDFGDAHPSGGSWTAYQGPDVQPSDGTTSVESEQPGAYGQSRCVFSSWVDYAHVSRNRRDVSTHGW